MSLQTEMFAHILLDAAAIAPDGTLTPEAFSVTYSGQCRRTQYFGLRNRGLYQWRGNYR